MGTDADRAPKAPEPAAPDRAGLARLAMLYTALTFATTWSCWGASWFALRAGGDLGPVGAIAGSLQVMGALCPPLVVYALFGRVRACGLAGAPAPCGDDPRGGFWRFAFGGVPSPAGWAAFAALAVWRWAMFRLAFGFPATPADALANFAVTLPALLLGGGLEEVGWRGCLQPALRALLGGGLSDAGRARAGAVAGELLAPLATGAVWAVWHVPLFFIPGAFQNGMPFLPFLLVAVALSYSLGALRAVGGTLAFPILAHAWYNAMLVAVPQFSPLALALFTFEALAGAAALTWRAVRGRAAAAR